MWCLTSHELPRLIYYLMLMIVCIFFYFTHPIHPKVTQHPTPRRRKGLSNLSKKHFLQYLINIGPTKMRAIYVLKWLSCLARQKREESYEPIVTGKLSAYSLTISVLWKPRLQKRKRKSKKISWKKVAIKMHHWKDGNSVTKSTSWREKKTTQGNQPIRIVSYKRRNTYNTRSEWNFRAETDYS